MNLRDPKFWEEIPQHPETAQFELAVYSSAKLRVRKHMHAIIPVLQRHTINFRAYC